MSAYRKEDRKEILEDIKLKGRLNSHDLEDLIDIIEDHEKRVTELEDSIRLEKLIKESVDKRRGFKSWVK